MRLGRLCCLLVMPWGSHSVSEGSDLRYIGPRASQGSSNAVVVGDAALAHTAQCLPLDARGELVGDGDIVVQARQVLDKIAASLAVATSSLDRLVKLNVYVTDQAAAGNVAAVLAKRFVDERKPAVSYVVTRLPLRGALVAMDAVAVAGAAESLVELRRDDAQDAALSTHVSIMPPGTRIQVSGQTERAETLVAATHKTLESLRNTVRFLGRRDADIAQLKVFFAPMSDVGLVQAEIASYFGKERLPPLVFVEWTMPLVEIELVAWGGNHQAGPVVEYLTPPGMSSSPVFSRVARVHSTPLIYTSGILAAERAGAESEVRDVFGQLGETLKDAGSDFRYLVKATYYCSTEDASRKLNELRPEYYDPNRPPAASKAMVAGVGQDARHLALDMIAVPAWDDAIAEYGPVEYGHGLAAEEARAGWVSLFDGQSTFGWIDAKVDAQQISAGRTTTVFGPCQLRMDVSQAGSVQIGRLSRELAAGRHEIDITSGGGAIQLDEAIRVTSLHLRPSGLESIFNGHDATGWRRVDRASIPETARPTWVAENGVLQAHGGPGAFEYTARQFDDFVLQLDVRTKIRHANGGVFFRAITGDFMNGYEVQIYHRALDGAPALPAKFSTGAIDDRQMARRLVSRDGTPTTMTIVAVGPHVATWVNGSQQTDWTDTRPPHENPREGLRTAAGAIQLQAHDPGTSVEFANLRMAGL